MKFVRFFLSFIGLWLLQFLLASIVMALLVDPENSTNFGIISIFLIMYVFVGAPIVSWIFLKRKRKKATDQQFALALEKEQRKTTLRKEHLRRRFVERERLIDAIDLHRVALSRNLQRAIKKNDYGVVTSDTSDDAIIEFCASIDLDHQAIPEAEAKSIIFDHLNFIDDENAKKGFDSNFLPFDGHEFERWVADSLSAFDWNAEVTQGSGDQGIDVIAEKDGKKIGLQCKLYSSAVGNKAIQEAHAGKSHYSLDGVGVLTNSNFTQSAKDLAFSTGVLLLSHHDIPTIDEKFTS